ncbi:hypothetical protein [Pseudobdellovibrio exovorus]|uniref:Uncharacterized protein n=1 Tax=Pseudobdellovibrio exovorus JSS TaxID=1184267 RepID=M4VBP6_9BACT|nr:hypothetical protein [Pseudobdellovibrio exovorus]AGH96648.1 hypothetical protein A11Q_2432 [Pseudobdellovibrio exovorus JSS]
MKTMIALFVILSAQAAMAQTCFVLDKSQLPSHSKPLYNKMIDQVPQQVCVKTEDINLIERVVTYKISTDKLSAQNIRLSFQPTQLEDQKTYSLKSSTFFPFYEGSTCSESASSFLRATSTYNSKTGRTQVQSIELRLDYNAFDNCHSQSDVDVIVPYKKI